MPAGTTDQRAATFSVGGVTSLSLILVAVSGSGSYDLVVRQGWAIVLWWALALAVLIGLAFRVRFPAPGIAMIAAFVMLGGWTALSQTWSASAELTDVETARVGAYLGVLLVVVSLVPATQWRSVIAGAAIAGVAVCAWSLAHRFWPDALTGTVSIFGRESKRLSAPFGYWNAVGAWAGMTVLLGLAFASHAKGLGWRALAGASVPLACTVAYLTFSRATIGGVLAGLIVLLAMSRNRVTLALVAAAAAAASALTILVVRQHPAIAEATGDTGKSAVHAALLMGMLSSGIAAVAVARLGADRLRMSRHAARIVAPATCVLVLTASAIAAAQVGPELWDQFTTTTKVENAGDPAQRLTDLSGARYEHYRVALDAFAGAPWRGTGAGTFEYSWNQSGEGGYVKDAHSLYLEALAELGIPGLVALLIIVVGLACSLVPALRRLEDQQERGILAGAAAGLSGYLLGAGVDWLWESPAVTVFACVLAGSILLAGSRQADAPRLAWRALLALGAVAMVAVQLPGLVATSEVRKSQDAAAQGDLDVARRHADDAIAAQPWAGSPWLQRALVDERAGAYDAAAQELRAAARRQPLDWRAFLLLARVEARRGNADAALAALRRARELRPKSSFFVRG